MKFAKQEEALARVVKLDTALKWVNYFSLPATVAETFLFGLPVIGTTLSISSCGGTYISSKAKERNGWIFFGQ